MYIIPWWFRHDPSCHFTQLPGSGLDAGSCVAADWADAPNSWRGMKQLGILPASVKKIYCGCWGYNTHDINIDIHIWILYHTISCYILLYYHNVYVKSIFYFASYYWNSIQYLLDNDCLFDILVYCILFCYIITS